MKKSFSFLSIIFLLIFSAACSTSKESTEKEEGNENDVYVFDELPVDDSNVGEENDKNIEYNYFVQIGAFATKSNAETFAKESSQILNEELEIRYDDRTYLYQVKLKKIFTSRTEAAIVRDRIRLNEKYIDAWVVREIK